MIRKVDVSHKTIFFIAGFLGFLWVIYQIRDVILLFFVAIILMSALSPLVDRLVRFRLPKALAVTIIYIVVFGTLTLLLAITLVPLIDQTASLSSTLPNKLQAFFPPGTVNSGFLQQKSTDIFGNILGTAVTVFSNTVAIISIAVLTFYLLLDKERFEKLLSQLFVNHQERALKLIEKIEDKLGSWLRGQALLSVVIGVLSYVLLTLLQIPYALPLAILAGLLEVVPMIGPIVSAIPAILVAYFSSPTLAIFVGIGYLVIQQTENHIIVPQVMKRAVGLNPLVVILAIAIGGRLLGIGGALLAVPITVVIQIIVEDLLKIHLDTNPT